MVTRSSAICCAAAAGAVALVSGSAFASTAIPAATVYGSVLTYSYSGYWDEKTLYALGSVGNGAAELRTSAGAGAYISAQSDSLYPDYHTDATGDLKYYAVLEGPPGLDVPIRLSYDLTATGAIGGFGWSEIELDAINSSSQQLTANSGQSLNLGGYLTGAAPTDQAIRITLSAQSEDGGFASADPVLEIDPTWALNNPADASQISFSFSLGVGNGFGTPASAPEPGAWLMLIAGMLGVGAMLRSTRRAGRTAAAA